jgi:hypothetical protein
LPWWLNLILALVVYSALKYWLPTVEFQSPLFQGVAKAFPNLAGTGTYSGRFAEAAWFFGLQKEENIQEQVFGLLQVSKMTRNTKILALIG